MVPTRSLISGGHPGLDVSVLKENLSVQVSS